MGIEKGPCEESVGFWSDWEFVGGELMEEVDDYVEFAEIEEEMEEGVD